MTGITDPAHEFADLCRRLSTPSTKAGAEWLASQFGVEPWSKEFYQILFTIVDRAFFLKELVDATPSVSHISAQLHQNIDSILTAFNARSLAAGWQNSGSPYLAQDNVAPILVLSAVIRQEISYPLLDAAQRSEIIEIVKNLLKWLKEHQLQDSDFIRQAIIEGLEQFLFRIERVEWLGYGYALQSLKDVIAAFLALERGFVDDGSMPVVEAFIKKIGSTIKDIYNKAGVAKDATETADFFIKAYGAASIYLNAKSGGIAGLLTFAG